MANEAKNFETLEDEIAYLKKSNAALKGLLASQKKQLDSVYVENSALNKKIAEKCREIVALEDKLYESNKVMENLSHASFCQRLRFLFFGS